MMTGKSTATMGDDAHANRIHGSSATGNDKSLVELNGNAGDEVFERLTAKLKARVGTEIYSSWFGRLKLDDISKSIVRLSVPTAFLRSWINNHYSELLTELWQEENPQILKVEVVVRGVSRVVRSAAPVETCEAAETKPAVAPREKRCSRLDSPSAVSRWAISAVPQWLQNRQRLRDRSWGLRSTRAIRLTALSMAHRIAWRLLPPALLRKPAPVRSVSIRFSSMLPSVSVRRTFCRQSPPPRSSVRKRPALSI